MVTMIKNIAIILIALGVGTIVAFMGYFAFYLSIYIFVIYCALLAMLIGFAILDCNGEL